MKTPSRRRSQPNEEYESSLSYIRCACSNSTYILCVQKGDIEREERELKEFYEQQRKYFAAVDALDLSVATPGQNPQQSTSVVADDDDMGFGAPTVTATRVSSLDLSRGGIADGIDITPPRQGRSKRLSSPRLLREYGFYAQAMREADVDPMDFDEFAGTQMHSGMFDD
eukprot:TRINITY_DN3858_c0_g1_i1.p3 TRINITY_DN3858_c0_g1~~TRINITY_DN3858_c0_g1_i1.p3  ORF type:complete len:169 (-),score=39.83 TRINITY_DN3858_c0_g1_i1:126-632(-)